MSWRKWLTATVWGIGAMVLTSSGNDMKSQMELCMIGDSITWAEDGDCFRKYLLELMPDLVFVGTHTAKFGYSHAGEGGDSTYGVLNRVKDPARVPDCRYYHLLIGINDCAAAKNSAQTGPVARGVAERIGKIIDRLLAKPLTEKVFVGTLLPCSGGKMAEDRDRDAYKYRDMAAAETNWIMRKKLPLYPAERVVMIEYEKPLRALPGWEGIIRLHPTPEGYRKVAAAAARTLKKHMRPVEIGGGHPGVEVTNLWNENKQATSPLIPGWYVVSFDVKAIEGNRLTIHLESQHANSLPVLGKQDVQIAASPGKHAEFVFMTGYEGYGYHESPILITAQNGKIERIQVEKMRPSQKASVYGTGTFIDRITPFSPGEKLISG